MDAQVKKVRMPMGIRKKMMAAISMLLVASIMLVSSSYAWFTLSTAPEITGITTSVGANGNLEVALLPASGDTATITSNTGDSMAVKPASEANITWGNLVDLSDSAFYGLDKISLYPSALNGFEKKIATNALSIPEYGADGRVAELVSTTATAGYDADAGVFGVDNTRYGVRAVGTSSNITPRALTFKSAKSTFNAKSSGLANPTKNAVNQNITVFLSIAMAGGAPENFSRAQVEAMQKIANGVQSSLNNTVNAYANAALAKAASASMTDTVSDDVVAMLSTAIAGETSAANLASTLQTANISYPALTDLAAQQAANQGAINAINALLATDATTFTTDEVQAPIANVLLGGSADIKAYNQEGVNVTLSGSIDASTVKTLYLGGGTVGAVANYAGTFRITEQLGITIYGGAKDTPAAITAVSSEVAGLDAPSGAGASNLTDFYGYVIDFAFRTNAAESNLQLQTEAANRVYSDATGADLATMGSGSTGTFTYNAASGLTQQQGQKLMESIRVVFFDTESGDLLKVAKFGDVVSNDQAATGKLTLFDYASAATEKITLGKDAYAETPVTTYVLQDTTKYTADNCTNYPANADLTITEAEYTDLAATTNSVADGSDWEHTLGKDAFKGTTVHPIKESVTIGGTTGAIDPALCWNYAATLTPEQYGLLKAASAREKKYDVTLTASATPAITALAQNTPKKLSVLVYMDGENIDNAAVGNAINSGTLDLNLQFSSSATLVPMQNNALKNLTNGNAEVVEPVAP